MNKVTVTREQMEVVKIIKAASSLKTALSSKVDKNDRFVNKYKIFNEMSIEQIVLAWHGYAEIEKEYVSFDEAMKALKDEENTVHFYFADDVIEIWNERQVNDSMQNNSSVEIYWRDLVNGKWSIEGDNL